MAILIAPDSFKDCLSAIDVTHALYNGIKSVKKDINVILFPIADGGEGTTEILNYHLSGRWQNLTVHDPIGRLKKSRYLLLNDRNTAVIELAKASGLELLKREERNPLVTNTFGTGELIRHALNNDAGEIILTIGGSATVDGGTGIAAALGFRFIDSNGRQFLPSGGTLTEIKHIDTSQVHPGFKSARWTIASDVQNILNGPEGAAQVYGPQKGADNDAVEALKIGLEHLSNIVQRDIGFTADKHAGTGAAGGAALFLMAYGNANLRPGFNVLAELTDFHKAIEKSSLIITGEGRFDTQSKYGKVVSSIAHFASLNKKPVIVVSGIVDAKPEIIAEKTNIAEIYTVRDRAKDDEDSIENAALYLEKIGADIARRYLSAENGDNN